MNVNTIENIKQEAERLKEDCIYSAKGHLDSAKFWRCLYYWLMIFSILSLCLSFTLTLIDGQLCTVICGLISSFITVILIFLNPQEKYLSHQNSGNKFLSLRNQIRIFNDIEIKNSNYIDEYTKRLIEFSKERNSLNENSLPIAETGYKNVKKQIEEETHIYEVDKNK